MKDSACDEMLTQWSLFVGNESISKIIKILEFNEHNICNVNVQPKN